MKPIKRLRKPLAALAVVAAIIIAAGCSPQGGEPKAAEGPDPAEQTAAAEPASDWSLATDCATCHSAEAATTTEASLGAGVHATTAGTDCATCHSAEAATTSEASLGAGVHATAAGTDCATCHSDEAALATVHQGADATGAMPQKLRKTTVEAQTCQAAGCHDLSAEELGALTADITDLTDSKGTTVNPHEVMGLTAGHGDIACSDCHGMHRETVAADTCVGCHHAGVYECNTCH